MLNEREELEKEMLSILEETSTPLGCGMLSIMLQQRGRNISEATVGRLLREFDALSYTDKTGYQGRVLSESGRKRLQTLRKKKQSVEWGVAFVEMLKSRTKEELIDVLIARRAIESELAYLAAQNAAPEDVKVLSEIISRQQSLSEAGVEASQEDIEFHAYIAKMAHNRILETAISKIREDTQLTPIFEFIRKHVHSKIYIDHQNILDAIIKQDADNARQSMMEHLTNIALDVEKYWKHIAK